MVQKYDKRLNDELFGIDYDSDYEESTAAKLMKLAKETIEKYGQSIVFSEWFSYLSNSVRTIKEARNFASWFSAYEGYRFKTKDPYPFLAMLFLKLGLSYENPESDDEIEKQFYESFDNFYIELVINAGFAKIDDYFYLDPYSDKRLNDEILKLKEINKNGR